MRSAFDRLSDDVICHIISFLPTNTSASTSVLARRWRFLWTHNPNLVFDEFDLRTIPLHRIIQRHRAKTFNTLSLTNVKCSDNQLATWIAHAVNRGIRNIHLDFGVPGDLYYAFVEDQEVDITSLFALPRFLLTCKTLVDLKIRCCKGIPSSGEVFLPSLKKLDLCCVVYDDEASLPHLLSGCPVLEDLTVECVYSMKLNGDYLGCVFVSSPTIKILKVDLEHGCRDLKIKAPSLEFLYLLNYSLEYITSLTTMTSLKEAHITLIQNFNDEYEYAAPAVKFLNCLCNLEYLYISIDSGEKLVHIVGLGSVVKFVNLTKLKLELMFDFHELVEFLEAADKLKHLTFTLRGKHNTYREPKQVPTCMLSCLKTVRINPFEDFNAHDFESIRYILRNAQVLERMEIHSSSLDRIYKEDLEEELEMLGRIPLLERGSESCQIVFC